MQKIANGVVHFSVFPPTAEGAIDAHKLVPIRLLISWNTAEGETGNSLNARNCRVDKEWRKVLTGQRTIEKCV